MDWNSTCCLLGVSSKTSSLYSSTHPKQTPLHRFTCLLPSCVVPLPLQTPDFSRSLCPLHYKISVAEFIWEVQSVQNGHLSSAQAELGIHYVLVLSTLGLCTLIHGQQETLVLWKRPRPVVYQLKACLAKGTAARSAVSTNMLLVFRNKEAVANAAQSPACCANSQSILGVTSPGVAVSCEHGQSQFAFALQVFKTDIVWNALDLRAKTKTKLCLLFRNY